MIRVTKVNTFTALPSEPKEHPDVNWPPGSERLTSHATIEVLCDLDDALAISMLPGKRLRFVNPPKWTGEKPKTVGKYWLSLLPRHRHAAHVDDVLPVEVSPYGPDARKQVFFQGVHLSLNATVFDGAQWAVREEPTDPFAKQPVLVTGAEKETP